ncbi:C1 family peptidase [Lactobacillus sp. PSON]|uniref:C1 family peptidase n=1 Tax=Lactobacillus sp. PSON TaxID=3455454 RepID=UPI004042811F
MKIDIENLKRIRTDFLKESKFRNTQNAVMENGIKKSIMNQSAAAKKPFAFSIDVDSDKVMNQKKSGRCWMFSALNFIRFLAGKKHHIKDFELSTTYDFFYDKLEKANYFYQNIIQTADLPISNRKVSWLLKTPQQDGGDWSLLVNLVEKYGVVPKDAMDETAVTENTKELDFMYNRKLQKDAMKLRELVNNDASDEKIKSVLENFNKENYRILSISFGTPPEKFTYEYRDENNQFHTTGEITPTEFFKKFIDINLDDYVELMNLPGSDYPYDRIYGIDSSENMVGGTPNRYLNLPMKELKRMAIEQLKDGAPVWYGCDVLQEWNNPSGLLDLDAYDWKRSFGIELGNNKTKRFEFDESLPTHAMLICGVDLNHDRPTKWKIQNSWGDKPGHKGYFIMGDEWMDQYTYEVVVNKKYLTDEEINMYTTDPIMLPFWNAMNPI